MIQQQTLAEIATELRKLLAEYNALANNTQIITRKKHIYTLE